jgi:hypothetical protein
MKKQSKEKPGFIQAFKDIKGFGNLSDLEKKDVKKTRFLKSLSKDK